MVSKSSIQCLSIAHQVSYIWTELLHHMMFELLFVLPLQANRVFASHSRFSMDIPLAEWARSFSQTSAKSVDSVAIG